MNRWTVVSAIAGIGIGAAAVGLVKNNGQGKMQQMANDFVKGETGRETR